MSAATASTMSTTSLRDPLRWTGHGACLDAPGLPWVDDAPSPVDVAAMAAVCVSCPVRLACASYAISAGVTAGFWAGQDRDPDRLGDVDDAGTSTTSTTSKRSRAGRVQWETLPLPGFEALPTLRRRSRRGVAA